MIKLILKIFVGAILTILALITFIFFYGSSSNYESSSYQKIIQYPQNVLPLGKDTFSVMTYNIGYMSGMTNNVPNDADEEFYMRNLKSAQNLVIQHQADFIGFQEIDFAASRSFYNNQLDSLANAGMYGYAGMAVNWDKKYVPFPYLPIRNHFGEILSGQAVLSKYPITLHERIVLEKPESTPFYYNAFYIDRLLEVNKIALGGQSLILMNVHLEAYVKETREAQAKKILEYFNFYSKQYPVLLIGDFNATTEINTDDSTIATIMKGLNIAKAIPDSTYNADKSRYFTYSSANPKIKIDYIFYNSDKILALDSKVVSDAGEISDHLPVYMEFVILNDPK